MNLANNYCTLHKIVQGTTWESTTSADAICFVKKEKDIYRTLFQGRINMPCSSIAIFFFFFDSTAIYFVTISKQLITG